LTANAASQLVESPGDIWRKGGGYPMKYFKISRTWIVKTEDETEASSLQQRLAGIKGALGRVKRLLMAK